MAKNASKNTQVLLGIVTAAAAGAAIGLLFAPEKGTDTRKKVKGQANDLADELLKALQQGKDKYAELKDEAASKFSEWRGKAEDKADEFKREAKNLKEDAKDNAKDAVDKA